MIALLDNQDSFTYNIYQYLIELGQDVIIFNSKQHSLTDLKNASFSHLIISPGPGHPLDANLSLKAIDKFIHLPILGICLGHQAIASFFGATINKAKTISHGKTSLIYHSQYGLFSDLPTPLKVCRYHSLAIDAHSLSDEFEVSALSNDCEIMAISHRTKPIYGVQFHPEAILSEGGHQLLSNFLKVG